MMSKRRNQIKMINIKSPYSDMTRLLYFTLTASDINRSAIAVRKIYLQEKWVNIQTAIAVPIESRKYLLV